MVEIIHKHLSYTVIGLVFKVFNTIGYGYREKYYQDALEIEFQKQGLSYQKEVIVPLLYDGKKVGGYRFDFVIEGKMVLEIKVANRFYANDAKQVYSYLKASGLHLGIIILITKRGIRYRRIVYR